MFMLRKTHLLFVAAFCAMAINVNAESAKASYTAMPNFLVQLWNAISSKATATSPQTAAAQSNRRNANSSFTGCPIDRETGQPQFGCEENKTPRRDDDGKPNPCTGRLCPDYTPDE
jgi:hypothetical protein